MNEIRLLIRNVRMLLKNPFIVPRELDTPKRINYFIHYIGGIMVTLISLALCRYVLEKFTESEWLMLFASVILSMPVVYVVAYLKELIVDKWIRKTFVDVDDIRFTVYGYVVIAPIVTFVAVLTMIL